MEVLEGGSHQTQIAASIRMGASKFAISMDQMGQLEQVVGVLGYPHSLREAFETFRETFEA